MKQNKRALTTHKAGERLSEKRQELIDFRQSLGVPGIALQHRPTSWHVESGRIHRVHLSSVVLDRSSSGRKKKRRSDSTRLQSRRQPTYHQCRWTWACKSVEWNAREISADMLVFTSHALKPLHLNVCPSSTARNTARSSSSLSDKSTSTLIRLKTHSAMHFHNILHFFYLFNNNTLVALFTPPGLQLPPNSNREHRLPPRLVLDERSPYLQCYSMGLFIILVVHIRDQPQIIIAAAHKHRHSVIVRRSSWRCRRCKKK